MADRLTQLQDCLDDMLTQMYATLNYIQTRHPYSDIPGQPSQAPEPAPLPISQSQNDTQHTNGNSQSQPAQTQLNSTSQPTERSGTPPPEHPAIFQAALRELAQGLVLKEQQMEILINSLPGLGNNERDQEQRMRELQEELVQVQKEREQAELSREAMVNGLGDVIGSIGRIP